MYIWHANETATAGFTMRDLEDDMDASLEQERLNVKVAELQYHR